MSFRQKLLLLFALTILVCVAVISVSVYSTMRQSFEQANQDRANSVAAQFRSEFQRRGEDVARKVESIAASETAQRIALEINRGSSAPNPGATSAGSGSSDNSGYLTDAHTLAAQQQLDFLELVDHQGNILSSAQWQAKFGYPEPAISAATGPAGAFLKREELPNGPTLGLFAIRSVHIGEEPLFVVGGERLDQGFLSTLDIPAGTRVLLYQNLDPKWNPQSLLDLNGAASGADRISFLIEKVRDTGQEAQGVIHWTSDSADAEVFHAIPLTGPNQQLMGILLVASSRRPLIELQRRVISTAMLVGGLGLLVAVLASLWFAARVTRPVVSLAEAARRVAAGDLNTKVEVESRDELGELAASFNRMTEDLLQQKDRAVQAERVAAWRELARRLAHELKNPLFPLQVTVENLMRAKEKSPEMFEEVFHESTATLLAEINNLKTIIGRFSEFSKMPQPQRQPTQVNDVLRSVLRVFQAQLQEDSRITVHTELAALPEIQADPDLLHRALSNLVLNGIDAMPQGGQLTLRTSEIRDGGPADRVAIEVSDTGSGLTPEECERLFTPYYTTKQHGTGLGLAIVQSVVSDHGGKISVESTKEKGTTFRIELPSGAHSAAEK
ncbi:MAG: ATP-binding protein [Terriglobales bacterium]|jgi:two-component system, NtrC family, nitrogen regulation sensor histidine kinase NtrY